MFLAKNPRINRSRLLFSCYLPAYSRSLSLVHSFVYFLPQLYESVGHKGKFGHEFMEFEFSSTGKLRYANNSNYKNDSMIRKEVVVSQAVLDEVRRIIQEADIIA